MSAFPVLNHSASQAVCLWAMSTQMPVTLQLLGVFYAALTHDWPVQCFRTMSTLRTRGREAQNPHGGLTVGAVGTSGFQSLPESVAWDPQAGVTLLTSSLSSKPGRCPLHLPEPPDHFLLLGFSPGLCCAGQEGGSSCGFGCSPGAWIEGKVERKQEELPFHFSLWCRRRQTFS